MIDYQLAGKTALITGAGQGLGRTIAEMLAAEGCRVGLVDIDRASVEQAAGAIAGQGAEAWALGADVSSAEAVEALVAEAMQRWGGVDVLINNAGTCPRTALDDIDEQEWDRVMAVNLKSVFLLGQAVLGPMKERGWGRIINMASGAGKVGGVQVGAHYSASKAGVICLTKTLALHAASAGVTVNAVCPGVMGTQMTYEIGAAQIARYREMIPLGRLGRAEEVAHSVLFLASEQAGYITGEIVDVNGGFIMD